MRYAAASTSAGTPARRRLGAQLHREPAGADPVDERRQVGQPGGRRRAAGRPAPLAAARTARPAARPAPPGWRPGSRSSAAGPAPGRGPARAAPPRPAWRSPRSPCPATSCTSRASASRSSETARRRLLGPHLGGGVAAGPDRHPDGRRGDDHRGPPIVPATAAPAGGVGVQRVGEAVTRRNDRGRDRQPRRTGSRVATAQRQPPPGEQDRPVGETEPQVAPRRPPRPRTSTAASGAQQQDRQAGGGAGDVAGGPGCGRPWFAAAAGADPDQQRAAPPRARRPTTSRRAAGGPARRAGTGRR